MCPRVRALRGCAIHFHAARRACARACAAIPTAAAAAHCAPTESRLRTMPPCQFSLLRNDSLLMIVCGVLSASRTHFVYYNETLSSYDRRFVLFMNIFYQNTGLFRYLSTNLVLQQFTVSVCQLVALSSVTHS